MKHPQLYCFTYSRVELLHCSEIRLIHRLLIISRDGNNNDDDDNNNNNDDDNNNNDDDDYNSNDDDNYNNNVATVSSKLFYIFFPFVKEER